MSLASGSLALPRNQLYETVEPIADRTWTAVIAAVSPVLLTSVIIGGYVGLVAPSGTVSVPVSTFAYGIAAIVVMPAVWWRLEPVERRAALPVDVPSWREVLLSVLFLPLGIAGFVAGMRLAGRFGFELGGLGYSLADPLTVVAIVFGAVIVAPAVEELLVRGLLLGALLARGWSPLLAALASIVVFAGLHVISLGVAGVFAIAGWSIFPTLLRLKYDNLVGAWLLHLLNNVYAYLLVVAFGLV